MRLAEIRAPQAPNADGLTQAQVRQMATAAVDYEQYNSAIISEIRLQAASQAWTQPPHPQEGTGGATNANGYPSRVGQEVWGEVLDGVRNGINTLFGLSHFAVPQTVRVFYNGLRLNVGEDEDYVIGESVAGRGFDTVSLTGGAPRDRDRLWADYIRSA